MSESIWKRRRLHYCSAECYWQASDRGRQQLPPRTCIQCGDAFPQKYGERPGVFKRRRFCTLECYRAYRDEHARRDERVCPICGDSFIVRHVSHNIVTCGKPECRIRYRNEVAAKKRSETMKRQYASGERQLAGVRERALWPFLAPKGWHWHERWTDDFGAFELDFCLPDKKLNVEIDGIEHTREKSRRVPMDAKRDAELTRRGWRILRIPNADVDESPEKVARKILRWAKTA
jgi:very-short-patch-repair endonuclease